MRYVAIINIPGYLPMADEPAVFDSAKAAWEWLAGELEHGELSHVPDDWNDTAGPWSASPTALEIDRMAREDRVGTVYGPSKIWEPDEDDSRDLGLAYSVEYAEGDEDDETPHVGHYSRLGGSWWCDTCNSPYCERL